MIGQQVSTSLNACMIRFINGPYNGLAGLWDHDNWTSIQVWDSAKGRNYVYTKVGPRLYRCPPIRKAIRCAGPRPEVRK